MDPNRTYADFLEALSDADPEIAAHRAEDLAHWLRIGGFIPAKLADRQLPTEILIRMLTATAAMLHIAAKDLSEG